MNHVDLEDLEEQLAKYPDHIKIGSFLRPPMSPEWLQTSRRSVRFSKKHGAYFFRRLCRLRTLCGH